MATMGSTPHAQDVGSGRADVSVVLWYSLGVFLPLLVAVSSVWWNWLAGWIPWGVALGMTLLGSLKFETELELDTGSVSVWRRLANWSLVVTGVGGLLVGLVLWMLLMFAWALGSVGNAL